MRKCSATHTPGHVQAIQGTVSGVLLLLGAWSCAPAGGDDSGPPAARAGQHAAEPTGGGRPTPASQARASGLPAPVQQTRPQPDHAWVIFGADTVVAEVARTDAQREQGLMYREEVPDGTGMLFVFDDLEVRSFWMENTYVPLDIAFLDASWQVVDIQQMAALTRDAHDSAAPAMFALEVRQGWFARHGIERGDKATVVFGVQLKK
jgi:uncharacterized protein